MYKYFYDILQAETVPEGCHTLIRIEEKKMCKRVFRFSGIETV